LGLKGAARFHLARANPLAEIDGQRIKLSFLGPDSYVSPDWYVTEGLVPTWNYIAVEGAGVARLLDRPALHQLLIELSALHEARLAPKPPCTLDKIPEKRLEALLGAIVGFEVRFDTLQGKFKLSQDKKVEDFEGVVAALDAMKRPDSSAVAAAMRRACSTKEESR
jgi:transcriptional regulator